MDDIRDRYKTQSPNPMQPIHRLPTTAQPSSQPQPQAQPPKPEFAAAASQPVPRYQPQAAPPQQKPQKRRLTKAAVTAAVMLAIVAGGGLYAYPHFTKNNPFPANIQTNAQVSLLYPVKLPAGYTIDPSKIQMTNGVLLYAASSGSKRLVFTIQQTPPSFDFAAFYKQQLQNSSQVHTKYGSATVGRNSGRYLASLVDGNTWMLVSSTDTSLSQQDLNTVLSNLKQY